MLNFPSLPRRNAEVRTDFLFRLQHKPLAPRVCAANAVDVEVDIEVDEIAALNIIGMPCALQILLAVIPSADAERLTTIDVHNPMSRPNNRKLPNIAAVAIVLRVNVLGLKIFQRHFVFANESGTFAVGIIFPRTTTTIFYVGKIRIDSHPHTKFWHQRKVGGGGIVIHIYHNMSVVSK